MKNLFFFLIFILSTKINFAISGISETPFSEYKFDAKECKVILHHKSRILIPSYTFYLDGKLYEGEVNLKYREFIDQLDIVLNNIPMNYAANDKTHVLESGGMFELYAYGNGKLLTFEEDKKISVQLATKYDIAGGETFKLNTTTKNWEKKTLFANVADANVQLPTDKKDMWNDNLWLDNDGQRDEVFMDTSKDLSGKMAVVQVYNSTSYNDEEIREQAFKTMNIDEMGIYNCDKILNDETIPLTVEFKLNTSNKQLNSVIYVVYKNRNAVLTYYPEQLKTDFKLLANEEFTIFSVAKDGKIAVVDKTFLAQFDVAKFKNKKVLMPMKVVLKTPTSKQELAMLTGL
ncbi:MAG: hypothetical protein IPF58_08410 [Saprospirales bacterium]|nr:hypothetical protein [Saprospirales bacterium]